MTPLSEFEEFFLWETLSYLYPSLEIAMQHEARFRLAMERLPIDGLTRPIDVLYAHPSPFGHREQKAIRLLITRGGEKSPPPYEDFKRFTRAQRGFPNPKDPLNTETQWAMDCIARMYLEVNLNQEAALAQRKAEVAKLIDQFMAENNTWTHQPNQSFQTYYLAFSKWDLPPLRYKIPDGHYYWSINSTKGGHIWGHKFVYSGPANGIQHKVGHCFFNYEKGKYLSELDFEMFMAFWNEYQSEDKHIITDENW